MPPYSKFFLTILIAGMILAIVKMFKYRKSHFLISSIVGSLIFAFFFTVSSVFWTTDIAYDRETLQHLEFGWPIPFNVEDQSRLEPPFPYEMDSGWGMGGYVIKKNFYLSLFINFLGVFFIWLIIHHYLNINKRNSLLVKIKIIKSKGRRFFSSFNTIVSSILFAFLFTVSSSFWMTNITYETESIKHSKFGWPVSYKIEKQIRLEPLPHEMGFMYQTSGSTIERNFYLSLFINFFGTLLIWISISSYLRSRDEYKKIKESRGD